MEVEVEPRIEQSLTSGRGGGSHVDYGGLGVVSVDESGRRIIVYIDLWN